MCRACLKRGVRLTGNKLEQKLLSNNLATSITEWTLKVSGFEKN